MPRKKQSNVIYGWQIQKRMYYLFLYYTTMWFMTPERAERVIASIMLKKEWKVTEPSFWRRTKNEQTGKREPTENLWTVVKGMFKKIEVRKVWEWDNAIELVEITLEDDEGTYVVAGSWTGIMCSIVNSLAWTVNEFKLLELEIWLYEKSWNDWKIYPRVYVKNQWQQTTWAYTIDQQKELISYVEVKGKKIKDDSKYIEELKKHFDKINWDELSTEDDEVFAEETPIVDSMRSEKYDDNEDLPF